MGLYRIVHKTYLLGFILVWEHCFIHAKKLTDQFSTTDEILLVFCHPLLSPGV
jgi:hypothetical protein